MHIPTSMLHGAVCPVTAAMAAAGVSAAVYGAMKAKDKPSIVEFSAVTAMVFAGQMLNFPITNGTSGHLLGAALAVRLLGLPFASLALTIVLGVQCLVFGDGGFDALGANIINMALIAPAAVWMIAFAGRANKSIRWHALGLASWFSVMVAAALCSAEVAASGAINISKVLPAMLGVHAIIGLGEAVITVAVVSAVTRVELKRCAWVSYLLALTAAIASPLASGLPDGLERVGEDLRFLPIATIVNVLFPDYQIPALGALPVSTITAALVGVAICVALSAVCGTVIKHCAIARKV